MAHPTDPDLVNHVLQLLTDQGCDGFAEGLRILVTLNLLLNDFRRGF